MKVYTASMGLVRKHYEEIRGEHFIVYCTAKHKSAFAPTWQMVSDHKNKYISDEVYTEFYMDKMRRLWKSSREDFDMLLAESSVVLVCFCPAGKFCHRHLLASIFEKLGATNCGELK